MHKVHKDKNNQKIGAPTRIMTLENARTQLSKLTHRDDPTQVLLEAESMLTTMNIKTYDAKTNDPIFKAMTLKEFDNGAIFSMSIPDHQKTFGIDLMRKIQSEYECITASEKATAELASINFLQVLEIQRKMKNYLEIGSITGNGVQYLAVLSKELDRANRHYFTAVQTLKMLKQPPMQLNIKTNTTIVGQNQIVQNNEPK